MIRRLTIIAFFTGLGQLFTIFALKYVSQFAYAADLKAIAEVDSTLQLVLNIVAMGLQSAAMRDLALSQDWRNEFGEIQSARISLGVLLMLLAGFYWVNPFYLVFLFAPIIAWNGDYALYARGKAITGSFIALIRLLIPFTAIIIMVHAKAGLLPWLYMIVTIGVYVVTNLAISLYLKTNLFYIPRFKNLRLYIKSLSLGVVVVSLYFIGLGLMLVVPYFYPGPVVAVAFLGLKFYMVFKGALRIIHQAFIKEMISYDVCFKVDQLAGLTGLTFCGFMIFFPHTLIKLFFGEKYLGDELFFILLSIAALIYSLFSSLIIKAMLEKKDRHYAKVSLFAALFTVGLSIVLSLFHPISSAIGISLVAGEIFFAVGMILLMKRPSLFSERIGFFAKNSIFLVIPLAGRFFFSDNLLNAALALGLFGLLIALLYYNKFSISVSG